MALVDRQVEHEVQRMFPRCPRKFCNAVLLHPAVTLVARLDDEDFVPFAVEDAELRRLRELALDRVSERRIGQRPPQRLGARRQCRPPCLKSLERIRIPQREIERQHACRHRTVEAIPALSRCGNRSHVLEHPVGIGPVVQERGDNDRSPGIPGKRFEEIHLGVAALREHEHTPAGFPDGAHKRP